MIVVPMKVCHQKKEVWIKSKKNLTRREFLGAAGAAAAAAALAACAPAATPAPAPTAVPAAPTAAPAPTPVVVPTLLSPRPPRVAILGSHTQRVQDILPQTD